MKKLSNFIIVCTCGLTLFMIVIIYVLVMLGYEDVVGKRAEKHAKTIADVTFNSLVQIMKKGGRQKDVSELLESNRKSFAGTNMNIVLYQSQTFARLNGRSYDILPDEQVATVFKNGIPAHSHTGSLVRFSYPLIASADCLSCHVNSRGGEVLGVIDTRVDIGQELKETRNKVIMFLVGMALIPLFASFILARLFSGRVRRSITGLHSRIEGVNRISDLRQLKLQDVNLGFSEFTSMFDEMKKVIDKLRDVAIDKDVLEFEVKLLERFIITSEIVRDWKAHVSHILIEINSIMETYFFFSLFMIDEESYDLEVFWRNTPSPQAKASFESIIREKIANSPRFKQVGQVNIIHNVALPLAALPPLREEDIELQTKSLFLEAPRIGGIVGIGVVSELGKYPARALVIESILATLLNVVGSVKAIYRYTKELEFYSTRDPLTNLFNQRVFWEMLGNEVDRSTRSDDNFALLHLDIDNFKMINDSYGYAFGDHLLQGVSEVVKAVLRRGDISARYGGDEFAIILPESRGQQAYMIAQRIREDLANMIFTPPDGGALKASVSIGMALFPTHAQTPKELFMMADNMRCKAKAAGKDQIAFPSDEDLAEVYRKISEKNIMIMKAIEERLIIPYFQPIVNVSNGMVEAHEVLMRINLPEKTVCAEEFISIAENMGVISKMDYILMEKAFQKASACGYKGLLFINISPKALILNEFIPTVRRLTKEYSIDPATIVFEITERETVKNMTLLERFVLDLKLENYKFAIDDFGAGFSSYQYLKRFPVDFIKVEGEFVRGMGAPGGVDLAIVKSIATLAQGLGIRTIGEYVENAEILGLVSGINLTYAQGYHVGVPAPELVIGPLSGQS
ncbi:putative bifunctional diguanylate cyclase/phosphodiesterase [Pelotalea chapellei]|uniref:Bifunctional diguanylate cyclase/phosphodiesterase n=1 Tax=Pelotalea chapellei TaxID=44671 RepID=A0ABS5UCA4_9BACT|nr:bifunctional diguanylate cyclase/phosphodiesterase [Pelotalea chapellei]MBT1073310.1 bifunctional diguanylate cyclase/phosphodiesterase [Pelotalea chapellei]